MSTETPLRRHYEDFSTTELETELARLLTQQEALGGELEAVLGPDPEGPVLWERLQDQIHQVRTLLRPMSPFVGGAVQAWPQGQKRLHLYAIPDTAHRGELLDELVRQGPILSAHHARVAAVPDEWLHITIGQVIDASEEEAETLAQTLSQWVEQLVAPPVTAMMRPMVTEHGVLLGDDRPGPHSPGWSYESSLEGVQRLLTTGARVAGIAGPDLPPRVRPTLTPHLATAYCRSSGSGRSLADQIGRTAPAVPVRVRELALVWARQDPAGPAYTWQTVATWPLDTPQ
jgi:2'-5' RNA ligase